MVRLLSEREGKVVFVEPHVAVYRLFDFTRTAEVVEVRACVKEVFRVEVAKARDVANTLLVAR